MKRFTSAHPNNSIRQTLSVCLFLLVFFGFLAGVSTVSMQSSKKQEETLSLAISRGIAHCYATEGHYPESLSDLLDSYGISYDEDAFFVDYQVLGENIFPDVTIIPLKE